MSGLDLDQAMRLMENFKMKLLQPEGMDDDSYNYHNDDKFFYLASHVDKSTQECIKLGDVDVDISKLLIKRKLSHDSKLEIINKEGRSYFMHHGEYETPTINNFWKWEQAFRILDGIYVTTHPNRANQLYQYK